MEIIELKNVTVSYRENVALKNVSLAIEEGTHLAVIGPNGAGKTTLLKAINGLARLLEGAVRIFGIKMTPRSASKVRKEIGYVPQMFNIDPRMPMRVKEVVMLGRYGRIGFFKRPTFKDKEIVDEVVDLIGIKDLMNRPIGHLSGGEQKKVAIARALVQQPRMLLLDEPLSNLDIKAQAGILELIDRIYQGSRLTTITVMHNLDLLPKSCSRMVLLSNGKIIFDGPVNNALDEKVLSELYGCRLEVIKNSHGVIVRARGQIPQC